ncbi:chaplin [Streptomyces sp. NPDC054766]
MFKLGRAAALTAAAGALVFAGAGAAAADAGAQGFAYGSPGVLSGNVVQIPIDVPINVCGNSLNVIGLLNPTFGNTCINGGYDHREGYDHGKGHDHGKGEG